jgi:hypothetical protein
MSIKEYRKSLKPISSSHSKTLLLKTPLHPSITSPSIIGATKHSQSSTAFWETLGDESSLASSMFHIQDDSYHQIDHGNNFIYQSHSLQFFLFKSSSITIFI